MAKKNKTVNYEALKKWLCKLDLHKIEGSMKGEYNSQDFALWQGYTMASVEKIPEQQRAKITIAQVVPYDKHCLCDALGGDISILSYRQKKHTHYPMGASSMRSLTAR
jgi:hypothetical protein